jgi:hypothetical protein
MEPDPHKMDYMLEFARSEYFEIVTRQFQTRMLALGILGGVMPIVLSILFPSTESDNPSGFNIAGLTRTDILVLVFIGLSFAYALLAITYSNETRRKDKVISMLESLHPGFSKSFTLKGKTLSPYFSMDADVSEPQGLLRRFAKRIWTPINFGILQSRLG